MDVSQDIMHVCVVDRDGNRLWEGSCELAPEDKSERAQDGAVVSHRHTAKSPLEKMGEKQTILDILCACRIGAYAQ